MRFAELLVENRLSPDYIRSLEIKYQGKTASNLTAAEHKSAENELQRLSIAGLRQIVSAQIPVLTDLAKQKLDAQAKGPANTIVLALQNLNLDNYKINSSMRVIVYVPAKDRKATMQLLLQRLDGAVFDRNISGSSIGGILYAGGAILVKPEGKTGDHSAGLANEKQLVDAINRFVEEVGALDITFVGDNGKRITANGVTQAISAGADTKGRKKSDVNLIASGKIIPISLKKSSAEYWESADTLWGNRADKVVEKLAAAGRVELTPVDKTRNDGAQFVKIKPEVAVRATPQETIKVVFGSDLLGTGGVVKQTFNDEHYKLEGNQLTVTADLVITEPDDIPENQRVYWLIRNDSTRTRPNHRYPGLRVLAAYASRINPKTLVLK